MSTTAVFSPLPSAVGDGTAVPVRGSGRRFVTPVAHGADWLLMAP